MITDYRVDDIATETRVVAGLAVEEIIVASRLSHRHGNA